ncbi:MAG: hypothetical protein Q9175_002819 [Cornicularia normoerica]
MKHELWNSSIELNGDVTASTWLRRQLIGFHGDEGEDIGWLFNKDLLISISGTSAIKADLLHHFDEERYPLEASSDELDAPYRRITKTKLA